MADAVMAAIIAANDGWVPVKMGLPLVDEVVAVTCLPKNGVRN